MKKQDNFESRENVTPETGRDPLTPIRADMTRKVQQAQPQGIAPAGNRVITPRDLAKELGGTAQWWERHRQRLVDAGLLIKAGRRFIGDMSKIQAAIADPELWADATE